MGLSFINCGPATAAATQTITAGGTPQTVFPASNRNYLLVVNTSGNTMVLTIDGSTPSATNGIILSGQGSSYVAEAGFVPNNIIQIWCASTGATFYAVQG